MKQSEFELVVDLIASKFTTQIYELVGGAGVAYNDINGIAKNILIRSLKRFMVEEEPSHDTTTVEAPAEKPKRRGVRIKRNK